MRDGRLITWRPAADGGSATCCQPAGRFRRRQQQPKRSVFAVVQARDFIAAIAHMLLTLLGAAGERCGLDRTLKSNTSKKRQMSLYNQGLHWYMAIPGMREERLRLLINAYGDVLKERELTRELFGVL